MQVADFETISWEVPQIYQGEHDALCSQAATAMVLNGVLGTNFTPEQVEEQVPGLVDEEGKPQGSLDQQIATWCLGLERVRGVHIDSADSFIIDQSWGNLSGDQIVERLKARMSAFEDYLAEEQRPSSDEDKPATGNDKTEEVDSGGLIVDSLGPEYTPIVIQAYIDFLRSGGTLDVHPYISYNLLHQRLQTGPVIASVCINSFHGIGKTLDQVPDDVRGFVSNHTIVLSGITNTGDFKVNDPDAKYGGEFDAERDRVITSIAAAQAATDNYVWQVQGATG